MKDPDNGSDAKTDEQNNGEAEDMSLADLLGGDVEEDEESPKRVEHRDDEPDSGMVNLAQMVADSSVEVAKVPSIIPPPAAPEPTGPHDTTGTVAAPTTGVGEQKKSSGPIYALIAVVVIALLVVVVVMMTGNGDSNDDPEARAAEIAAAAKAAAEEARAAFEAERKAEQDKMAALEAKLAEMATKTAGDATAVSAEEQAKMDEIQKQLEEAKAKEEELAKQAEEAAKKAEDSAKKKGSSKGKSSGKTKVASAGGGKSSGKTNADDILKKDTGKKTSGKKTSGKKESGKKESGKKSADELDSLLGGGGKQDEPKKETKPAGPALPKKLSQTQVKKGMGPVQARAQKMCSKYSTGVVQVKLVIGGNGRVKSANPKGAFSNSTAGKCVAMQARTAKFPKFSDASQSVLFPITLK